jgi:hypothetical protein
MSTELDESRVLISALGRLCAGDQYVRKTGCSSTRRSGELGGGGPAAAPAPVFSSYSPPTVSLEFFDGVDILSRES